MLVWQKSYHIWQCFELRKYSYRYRTHYEMITNGKRIGIICLLDEDLIRNNNNNSKTLTDYGTILRQARPSQRSARLNADYFLSSALSKSSHRSEAPEMMIGLLHRCGVCADTTDVDASSLGFRLKFGSTLFLPDIVAALSKIFLILARSYSPEVNTIHGSSGSPKRCCVR
jgi:hypothetical protein